MNLYGLASTLLCLAGTAAAGSWPAARISTAKVGKTPWSISAPTQAMANRMAGLGTLEVSLTPLEGFKKEIPGLEYPDFCQITLVVMRNSGGCAGENGTHKGYPSVKCFDTIDGSVKVWDTFGIKDEEMYYLVKLDVALKPEEEAKPNRPPRTQCRTKSVMEMFTAITLSFSPTRPPKSAETAKVPGLRPWVPKSQPEEAAAPPEAPQPVERVAGQERRKEEGKMKPATRPHPSPLPKGEGTEAVVLLEQGAGYLREGHLFAAETPMRRLAERHPDYLPGRLVQAVRLRVAGSPEDHAAAFEGLKKTDPGGLKAAEAFLCGKAPPEGVCRTLGQGYLREVTDDRPGALDHYTRAMAEDPGAWLAPALRAVLRAELGFCKEAAADFKAAAALNPSFKPGLNSDCK